MPSQPLPIASLAEKQIDLLPLGICTVDRELIIQAWNDRLVEWTGLSSDDAIGTSLLERFPHLKSPRFLTRVDDVFQSHQSAVFSPSVSRSVLPVSLHGDDSDDAMIQKVIVQPLDEGRAMISVVDVTVQYKQIRQLRQESQKLLTSEAQLLKTKQEAVAANRAKSEFLANMSHEIRTPMTAILGFTDVLLENLDKPENLDAAQTIKRNGQYLLELINDILDLSKIEAGKLKVELIDCHPCTVISDVAALMQVRATAKGLSLEVRYDGPLPQTIQSDPTRLRQILINIVGNAIKFTETGSVQIVTRLLNSDDEPPKLQVDVVDSGIGIDEDQITNLFLPFTQADNSTTRKFGGTGLGLTICKRLVQTLGGEITVHSDVQSGSTFTITVATGSLDGVPLIRHSDDSKIGAAQSTDKDAADAQLKECRVLLAEDGPDNQRLLSFILKKAGAEVVVAGNGQVALESATAALHSGNPFHVILMDMQMPVLDGYAATRQLRDAGYTLPIVALTAHAMTGDREKCLEAGCNDYTTKPINRRALVALIAGLTNATESSTTDVDAP